MSYLWIVNWDRYQHYKDRRPVWIKFYLDLLDDRDLRELPLATRLLWDQLLLLVARYENPLEHDAKAIASLTRIDLRSVREGIRQLIAKGMLKETRTRRKPAKPKEDPASNPASKDASEPASTHARPRAGEEAEAEKAETSLAQGSNRSAVRGPNGLPFSQELLIGRLLEAVGAHADEGTAGVFRHYAVHLPEASLAKVLESVNGGKARNRAKYVTSALKDELAALQSLQEPPAPEVVEGEGMRR